MQLLRIVLFVFIFSFYACDHGLDPGTPFTGISGKLFYQNWPAADSIIDLRLVIFTDYPPPNADETWLRGEISEGRVVFHPKGDYDHLEYDVDSAFYQISLNAGTYEYMVVARRIGAIDQWLVVGHYDTTLTDSLPTAIEVYQDRLVEDVNIYIDFDSLPPTPF